MDVKDKLLHITDEITSEQLWRPKPTPLCKYCDFTELCETGKNFILNNQKRKATKSGKPKFGEISW